jgi:hypothetical protein
MKSSVHSFPSRIQRDCLDEVMVKVARGETKKGKSQVEGTVYRLVGLQRLGKYLAGCLVGTSGRKQRF